MRFQIPDPVVHATIVELTDSNPTLWNKLEEFAQNSQNNALQATHIRLISDAAVAVARALLMAKCVAPRDEDSLNTYLQDELSKYRSYPPLTELGLALIGAERATAEDVFRDRTLIDDAMFEKRLDRIKQCLVQ